MRTIKIYCKVCNLKLTDELIEVGQDSLRHDDGISAIEENKFSVITEDFKKKELIVKINDYYLKNHKNRNRFSGCCGSAGLDGMNKTCQNGHEVATEMSDCYMPHYIVFDLDKIVIKGKKDDYNLIKINI